MNHLMNLLRMEKFIQHSHRYIKSKQAKRYLTLKNDEDLFDITIDTAKDNIKFFSEEGGKAKEENFDEIVKYSRRFDSRIKNLGKDFKYLC